MRTTLGRLSGAAHAVAIVLAAAPALAQSGGNFSITKSTLNASGGSSTGGNFSVVTTIGSSDAGAASGGTFALDGGYGSGDPFVCIPPTAASAVAASEDRCDLVQIVWSDGSTDEDGFEVIRDGSLLALTAPDVTSFDDSTAVTGVTYQYVVVAVKACGNADSSAADPGRKLELPAPPDGLAIAQITAAGDSVDVDLNWTDNAADEQFQLVSQLIGALPPTVVDTVAAGLEATTVRVASASDPDLCFTITAINCGIAAASDSACVPSPAVSSPAAVWVPESFDLKEIRPNPFRQRVQIVFDVPGETKPAIEVFDVTGRRVASLGRTRYGPGRHSVEWRGVDDSGRRVSSGIYFLRMTAPDYSRVRRLVLLN